MRIYKELTREEKDLRNKKQRERRKRDGNSITKKYEKTHKGFLMRMYRNMQSRVEGVQKKRFHLYQGKALLDREVFYEWALNNTEFLTLFEEYEKSGYERKLAPSVDRIDSRRGYELDNMEFVAMSENSRRGATSPYR